MDPKQSNELLENLKAHTLFVVHSIKKFDFRTLYTTIPHDKLKSKFIEIINNVSFIITEIVGINKLFSYLDTYFVKDHSGVPTNTLK